ncbi:TPA: hypothetical protein I8Y21_003881 [Klebsiella oxytoca]|uniref:Prophage protein n=1 Tax=Klebsiella oxytoca TaxID=571 RepID=A0AAN5LB72_KLEOX|nr:hypothetical protein [Klebsiella oxytoca]
MSKLNFAHLLGRNARASEEDDEKESRKAKSGRAEEDEKDKSSEEEDKGKDASESDDGGDGDGDDGSSENTSASASEEDDGDQDDKESPAVKKGRRAERARCATIFACREASYRPDMAAHLAFNTSMSAKEAVSLMKTMGARGGNGRGGGESLASRMAGEPDHRAGQDSRRHQQGADSAMTGLLNAYNTIKGVKK